METIYWRTESIPQFVLGTAQLGIPGYGVASHVPIRDQNAVDSVVSEAWNAGIRYYDTAQGYGESEYKLGRAFAHLGVPQDERKIITKIDPGLSPHCSPRLETALEKSLSILGDPLWCVMLHHFSWLSDWENGLGRVLKRARDAGKIQFLGVSVYEPAEAMMAIKHPDMDIIQVPANAWDIRLVRNGCFTEARNADKLIFVRSVFLQGLLLLPPGIAGMEVKGTGPTAAAWLKFCQQHALTPLEMAVTWAKRLGFPLVLGAETAGQIREIATALDVVTGNDIPPFPHTLDESLLNPSNWPKNGSVYNGKVSHA